MGRWRGPGRAVRWDVRRVRGAVVRGQLRDARGRVPARRGHARLRRGHVPEELRHDRITIRIDELTTFIAVYARCIALFSDILAKQLSAKAEQESDAIAGGENVDANPERLVASERMMLMRLMPRKVSEKIGFCEGRVTRWAESAAALGTSDAAVADLMAKLETARQAYRAQMMAQRRALSATADLRDALDAMDSATANIILQIRAKAGESGNSIYTLALLSPPEKPSPIGAPGTPKNFTFTLTAIGTLSMKWECKNPRGSQGTVYQIRRSVDDGPFEFLDMVGKKRCDDESIPTGARQVQYEIQAIRSTRKGRLAIFNVNLGVSPEMARMIKNANLMLHAA